MGIIKRKGTRDYWDENGCQNIKRHLIKYLDPLTDKQTKIIFYEKIEYLTSNEIKEKYGVEVGSEVYKNRKLKKTPK